MPISHVFNDLCPGSSGVEQRTENPRVGSSNLPPGTISSFASGHHQTSKKLILTYFVVSIQVFGLEL